MTNFLKKSKIFILIICLFLSVSLLCACNEDNQTESSLSSSDAVSEESVSTDELLEEIVGQWGRLDEVMHYFNADKTCIVGGMQGTYDIDESNSLILTTMDGIPTTYEWARSSTQAAGSNYWYLDDNVITINGNTFTKIVEEETPTVPK